MYHENRAIRDKELIKAVLDICDVINVGLFDDEFPYVLPLNFGYEFEDDLVFYMHHAVEGYKIKLVEKNPKVGITTYRFLDTKQSSHDYRSVMAFGEMSFIPRESDEYVKAWELLCRHNGRKVPDRVFAPDFPVLMGKIVCRAENVIGKAQYPVGTPEEIPLIASEDEELYKPIPRRKRIKQDL